MEPSHRFEHRSVGIGIYPTGPWRAEMERPGSRPGLLRRASNRVDPAAKPEWALDPSRPCNSGLPHDGRPGAGARPPVRAIRGEFSQISSRWVRGPWCRRSMKTAPRPSGSNCGPEFNRHALGSATGPGLQTSRAHPQALFPDFSSCQRAPVPTTTSVGRADGQGLE